jgi:hypothetical protein
MAAYAQLNSAAVQAAAARGYETQMFQQLLHNANTARAAQAAQAAASAVQQQQRALQQQFAAAYGVHSMAAAAAQQMNPAAAAAARPAPVAPPVEKTFNGKLTQIKEFPMEQSHQPPYKLQKALIDQKIVPCINVRPYVFHDLMMTLPDFVRHFYPDLTIEKARQMLQDILKVVLYKGNR